MKNIEAHAHRTVIYNLLSLMQNYIVNSDAQMNELIPRDIIRVILGECDRDILTKARYVCKLWRDLINTLHRDMRFDEACVIGSYTRIMVLGVPKEDIRMLGISLERACRYGHMKIYRLIMKSVDDACIGWQTEANKIGWRHIVEAASMSGDINMVESVITKKFKCGGGHSLALYTACEAGHLDIVIYLLGEEQPLDHILRSCLTRASRGGSVEVVKLLISRGAKRPWVALHRACHRHHLPLIEYLISISHNYKDWDWSGGLNGACEGGHEDLFQSMSEKGANDWNMALHFACIGGHMNIILLAIKNGANNFTMGLDGAACGYVYDHRDTIAIMKLMIAKGGSLDDSLFDDTEDFKQKVKEALGTPDK